MINVRGIPSPFMLVMDASIIMANTIPLAPKSPVGNKRILTKPVTSAVTTIMTAVGKLPNFSSINGPTNNRVIMFPLK